MKQVFISLAGFALLCATAFGAEARKAPDFSFDVPGQGAKSLSQYAGKVVALEFIFTTCPHCQAASKVMTKLQGEYASRGLQVLDVAVNQNADLLVENFAKDFHVNFPVGWTTQEKMVAFMGFSSARFVVPQLALIDRKGYIRYQTPATEDGNWDKLMTEDAVRQHIEELLAAEPNSASSKRRPQSHATSLTPRVVASRN